MSASHVRQQRNLGNMQLVVSIRLLSSVEGGRSNPISLGYRASWNFRDLTRDGLPHLHDAPIVVLSPDPLLPGVEGEAEIVPLAPEFWSDVHPGALLSAHEGSRRVATATLIRRID